MEVSEAEAAETDGARMLMTVIRGLERSQGETDWLAGSSRQRWTKEGKEAGDEKMPVRRYGGGWRCWMARVP